MRSLRIHDIKWSTDTAGPGPDGSRTELFLRGCRRARLGQPCQGCFNSALWKDDVENKWPVDHVVRQIVKNAPSPYVTIGGGEPTDQLYSLIDLVHGLKRNNFHIILYTWRSLIELTTYNYGEVQHLLGGVDILVDGEYQDKERIYNPAAQDGVRNWIGSGNQTVWDIQTWRDGEDGQPLCGYQAGAIEKLTMDFQTNQLRLVTAQSDYVPKKIQMIDPEKEAI